MDLEKHQKLYSRMKAQVARDAPESVSELDKVLADYTGDTRILEHFLTLFGSDNPWKAASNAKLRQAIYRTPEEIRSEANVHGLSVSGHKLTNQLFVLSHTYDPTRVWRSGARAITKIMEVFGSSEQKEPFTVDGEKKISEEKRKQRKKTVSELAETLDDVLKAPSRVQDVQSRNDRIKVHSILGLDDELKRRLAAVDKLIYGESAFVDEKSKSYLLSADKGGMFFGWFNRQLVTLPQAMRDIYSTVTSTVVTIPEEERRFMMGSLIAYAAVHMPIRRESVIGGYQKDLDFILKLPKEHPLVETYGVPDLTSVRSILEKSEITLVDATKIFDVYPIDDVRLQINTAYKNEFKKEIESIVKKITPLFMSQDKWQSDSYDASLPWNRIKNSVYAATLMKDEFRGVRDFLRLQTVAITDERTCKATAMQEYKSLIDKMVIAKRKIDFLEKTFQDENVTIKDSSDASLLVEEWKTKLLRRSNLVLKEQFFLDQGITLDEFISRADYACRLNEDWQNNSAQVQREAQFGLYTLDVFEKLASVLEKTKTLTPLASMQEQVSEAFLISAHPFIRGTLGQFPNVSKPYLFSHQKKLIEDLVLAKEYIKNAQEAYGIDTFGRDMRSYANEVVSLRKKVFYDGSITDKVFAVRKEYDRNAEPFQKIGESVFVLDAEKIGEYVKKFEEDYLYASNLSSEWRNKASLVVSLDAKNLLSKLNIEIAGRNTFTLLVDRIPDGVLVSRTIISDVEKTYEKMCSVFSYAREVMREGMREGLSHFENAPLTEKYAVTVRGTTSSDAGRFGEEFQELRWNRANWVSHRSFSKARIGELSERIRKYNETYGTVLRMDVGFV